MSSYAYPADLAEDSSPGLQWPFRLRALLGQTILRFLLPRGTISFHQAKNMQLSVARYAESSICRDASHDRISVEGRVSMQGPAQKVARGMDSGVAWRELRAFPRKNRDQMASADCVRAASIRTAVMGNTLETVPGWSARSPIMATVIEIAVKSLVVFSIMLAIWYSQFGGHSAGPP